MTSSVSATQRTATTAKLLLLAGIIFAAEALLRGSVVRVFMASGLLVFGAGLFLAARHAEQR